MPDVENQVIADVQSNHFQLVSIGWNKSKFIYNCKFHFDIKNEKIWLQRNMTEVMIADELVKKGVDKTDIVLGFVPMSKREYTGFGVA